MGAQGAVEVDFGAFPGAVEKETDVATAGVVVTSLVEAWLVPKATADHTVDEHIAEDQQLDVQGRYLSDGNIRIRVGINDREHMGQVNYQLSTDPSAKPGAQQSLTYGKWNVGWVWN
jgi:hypothetical protein